MYKLQSGIPIPSRSKKKGVTKVTRYPFNKLEPGMSFLVPKKEADGNLKRLMARVSAAAKVAKKSLGIKLVLRQTEEGIRVWRVANA